MADDIGGSWSSAGGGGGGFSAGGIGGIASGLVGAAGSLFGGNVAGQGYEKEAKLYEQAAGLTEWNQKYHTESGQIQTIMAARQGMKTIGAQQAAVAAAGFAESGSSLYLLRDSQAQLGITKGMIGIQTGLNVADDQEKALAYRAQAEGARAQAKAAQGGGILGALGSIAGAAGPLLGLLSDRRLKENIEYVKTETDGINWYTFNFIGKPGSQYGVMADEVLKIKPHAVHVDENGYLRVNYAELARAV